MALCQIKLSKQEYFGRCAIKKYLKCQYYGTNFIFMEGSTTIALCQFTEKLWRVPGPGDSTLSQNLSHCTEELIVSTVNVAVVVGTGHFLSLAYMHIFMYITLKNDLVSHLATVRRWVNSRSRCSICSCFPKFMREALGYSNYAAVFHVVLK